jgi:hypothetical protein
VSVGIPGVGSVTVGGGSAYYSPYNYGYGQSYYTPSYGSYYVPSGFATSTYNYPTYSNYYSGSNYSYPTTYGSSYSYPTTYSSGYYSYPSYNTSGYYPSYGTSSYYPSYGSGYSYPSYSGYYNPGWGGYSYGNTTFGQGLQSGVVQGALGVPNWYGYGGYYGGNTVQGTVGNYLGREIGRAIFD